jgi:hypothetical protein
MRRAANVRKNAEPLPKKFNIAFQSANTCAKILSRYVGWVGPREETVRTITVDGF